MRESRHECSVSWANQCNAMYCRNLSFCRKSTRCVRHSHILPTGYDASIPLVRVSPCEAVRWLPKSSLEIGNRTSFLQRTPLRIYSSLYQIFELFTHSTQRSKVSKFVLGLSIVHFGMLGDLIHPLAVEGLHCTYCSKVYRRCNQEDNL
jgi:hypothetical protein